MTVNGNKRAVMLYLFGVIQALVVLAGTYWVGRIEGLQAQQIDHERRAQELIVSYESRVTALEAKFDAIQKRLDQGQAQLDRIEQMLREQK